MFQRRMPEWLRHAPTPSVKSFAILAGLEAVTRGILVSVFPLAIYRALKSASLVSEYYFLIGVASLITGLMVPWLIKFIPRRWMYTLGCCFYICGSLLAMTGQPMALIAGLMLNTIAVVTVFVCFNAYVLDYVAKFELSRAETLRLFYSALGWTLGPVCGVLLYNFWESAPFLLAVIFAIIQLVVFWHLRLGNGKQISRARQSNPNPIVYIGRFFAQKRLVAGWLLAMIRSCGWWVYVVYLPIFCVENGLGDELGGILLSLSNAALFVTPFMLKAIQKTSIKWSVRTGFLGCAILFGIATIGSEVPWFVVVTLAFGSLFLVFLDVCAGLPFLMAVKPSERTEMSAIYSSFRDVSSIATPGAAWLILLVAPLPGVFGVCGLALLVAYFIGGKMHPRLGKAKLPTQSNAPLPGSGQTTVTP
jgi:ACDE family multidrug resistance protein